MCEAYALNMWLLLLFALATSSLTPSLDVLYQHGNLADIAAHQPVDDAAAFVWVARAANTEAQFVHTSGPAFEDAIDRAIAAAEQALALEPGNWEATLELARALGYRALTQGILKNMSLAPHIKGLLESVITTSPGNPDGLIALARMHQQLHQSGAGWLYGAKPALITTYTEQALGAAPNRIGIKNEAAIIARDMPDTAWACELLAAATALVPTSWVEAQEAARAVLLQGEIGCL